LTLSPHDLGAIAAAVATELERRGALAAKLDPERLAFGEKEGARAIGVPWYTLRNARLARDIKAKKIGKSYVYSRSALLAFVEADGGRARR
jgi:hypothetical protein